MCIFLSQRKAAFKEYAAFCTSHTHYTHYTILYMNVFCHLDLPWWWWLWITSIVDGFIGTFTLSNTCLAFLRIEIIYSTHQNWLLLVQFSISEESHHVLFSFSTTYGLCKSCKYFIDQNVDQGRSILPIENNVQRL